MRWTAVDDFGIVINPMIVEGQVHGGIAQGVGQALCEGAVYDKDGQLVTGSFMDYAMPRADYFPSFKVGTTVTKCPSNPLGIKGCGEAGRDRGAGRRDQRHHRRHRHRSHRHAGDAASGVGGAAEIRPSRAAARGDDRRRDKRRTAMYSFTYHRPETLRQAANLLGKNRGSQAPGRRSYAACRR